MKSDLKAYRYITEEKVFPLTRTDIYERWGVEGDTGVWTVTYDTIKKRYSCSCKNIRSMDCSHKKAVKIKRGI